MIVSESDLPSTDSCTHKKAGICDGCKGCKRCLPRDGCEKRDNHPVAKSEKKRLRQEAQRVVDDQRGPLQLDLNEDNLFGKLDKSFQVAEVTEQKRRGFRISDADGLEACKRVLKELDIKVPQKLEERVSSIGEKSDVRLLEQVANMGDLIVTSFANLVASSDDSALMVRNSIANRLKPDEPADEVLSMVSDCFT